MSTPASTGPAICVICCAPPRIAFTCATACSSSPATSGTTSRDEAKYGAAKTPTANAVMRSERFLNIAEIIKRPYGFVKWEHAEGQRGASRGPPRPDPRRRPQGLRDVRLRRRHRGPPRGGDGPVAGRHLPLLRGEEGALHC